MVNSQVVILVKFVNIWYFGGMAMGHVPTGPLQWAVDLLEGAPSMPGSLQLCSLPERKGHQ